VPHRGKADDELRCGGGGVLPLLGLFMPRRVREGERLRGEGRRRPLDGTAGAASGVVVMLLGACKQGPISIRNDKYALHFCFSSRLLVKMMGGPHDMRDGIISLPFLFCLEEIGADMFLFHKTRSHVS